MSSHTLHDNELVNCTNCAYFLLQNTATNVFNHLFPSLNFIFNDHFIVKCIGLIDFFLQIFENLAKKDFRSLSI